MSLEILKQGCNKLQDVLGQEVVVSTITDIDMPVRTMKCTVNILIEGNPVVSESLYITQDRMADLALTEAGVYDGLAYKIIERIRNKPMKEVPLNNILINP